MFRQFLRLSYKKRPLKRVKCYVNSFLTKMDLSKYRLRIIDLGMFDAISFRLERGVSFSRHFLRDIGFKKVNAYFYIRKYWRVHWIPFTAEYHWSSFFCAWVWFSLENEKPEDIFNHHQSFLSRINLKNSENLKKSILLETLKKKHRFWLVNDDLLVQNTNRHNHHFIRQILRFA